MMPATEDAIKADMDMVRRFADYTLPSSRDCELAAWNLARELVRAVDAGELARVKELESQVRVLRDAMEVEYSALMAYSTCSERFERHGPTCSHRECYAIYRMRRILAATDTKGQ